MHSVRSPIVSKMAGLDILASQSCDPPIQKLLGAASESAGRGTRHAKQSRQHCFLNRVDDIIPALQFHSLGPCVHGHRAQRALATRAQDGHEQRPGDEEAQTPANPSVL